jgi:hypothetical protein
MEALKMMEQLLLGKWSEEKLNDLLREASSITGPGKKIDFLSGQFLDTKYEGSTLIGDADTAEVFVINLEGLDCFTFLDYIEAMRRSVSFSEFKVNLKKVRYRSGQITFESRNHFFTDWKEFNSGLIVDVTKHITSSKSKDISKRLNEKSGETFFIPGITCSSREVTYIRSMDVDDSILENLKTGDFIGIYSELDGLDVSHVGIFIRDRGKVSLRHASSAEKYRRVIDEDFKTYLQNKPGIIVFRPIGP